ncbi:hypothetical protein C0991_007964 [Blastosporella zonata]|nr:hypothetical protein C0991_007964 [Blastosporella zonata]
MQGRGTSYHLASSPNQAEFIVVDDDDGEDVGVSVPHPEPSTPDGLDLLPRASSSTRAAVKRRATPGTVQQPTDLNNDHPVSASALKKHRPGPPQFRVHHDDEDELTGSISLTIEPSGLRQLKDGTATRALQAEMNLASDPIEDFPSSPPRTVRGMVQAYENKRLVKKIDLKAEEKRKKESIKGGMKGKNGIVIKTRNDPIMAPTLFKGSSRNTKKLWLEKWYIGVEFRTCQSSCYLTWDDGMISFWENEEKILWFKLGEDLDLIQCSEDWPYVIKLKTKLPRTANDRRNNERFKMGDRQARGTVVIFLCFPGHAEANSKAKEDIKADFAAFIRWVKEHKTQAVNISRTIHTNPEGVRRSARRRRSPSLDPEEVILCYPQGIPGAVYIKNSDYRRLAPGEYLNDTLIEFGLKLWLRRLQESNPELASQIHVFSSFFYKKLNNKNADEGYESVRKWTSKIDIFSKKYIIIPINENLHWYLVIIYQPEHILYPPPPPITTTSPTTRGQKKAANAAELSDNLTEGVLKAVFASKPSPPPPLQSTTENSLSSKPPSTTTTSATTPPSPAPSSISLASPDDDNTSLSEEERKISENLLALDPSCTVDLDTVTSSRATSDIECNLYGIKTGTDETAASEMDVDTRLSPTVSDFEQPSDVEMGDEALESSLLEYQGNAHGDKEYGTAPMSIVPVVFYGKSNKAMSKQKAISNKATHRKDDPPAPVLQRSITGGNNDPDHEDDAGASFTAAGAKTYIYTFDSLGSKHPQAIKVLTRYLKQEAQDKRKQQYTSTALGRQAQVPVQPNFCDCGLYLLHFAETFISDPVHYSHVILTRTKATSNAIRLEDWKGERTGDMRERLRGDIDELSVVWKAAKEEEKRKEAAEGPSIEVIESSDDEVDILETTPAPMSVKATKKGGKRKPNKVDPPSPVLRLR